MTQTEQGWRITVFEPPGRLTRQFESSSIHEIEQTVRDAFGSPAMSYQLPPGWICAQDSLRGHLNIVCARHMSDAFEPIRGTSRSFTNFYQTLLCLIRGLKGHVEENYAVILKCHTVADGVYLNFQCDLSGREWRNYLSLS